MSGISDKAIYKLTNQNKFNGGVELEEDYGVNIYSTFYRQYDPQLGRFSGVDILSEQSAELNGYHFSGSNPISFNDPMGDKFIDRTTDETWHHADGLAGTLAEGQGSQAGFGWDGFGGGFGGTGGEQGGGGGGGYAVTDGYAFQGPAAQAVFKQILNVRNNSTEGNILSYTMGQNKNGDIGYWQSFNMDNGSVMCINLFVSANAGINQNHATKQFIAIVAGESTNNINEAAAIGSVMMNRMVAKNADLTDGFVKKIGHAGQYDAIGGKIYNTIMNSSWKSILSPSNPYANRISGAIMSLTGTDYSNGAYFWNASTPQTGANWNSYTDGTFSITTIIGGTTFFKYSKPSKTWP